MDLKLDIISDLSLLESGKPTAGISHSLDVLILENRLPMMMAYNITDPVLDPFLKVK